MDGRLTGLRLYLIRTPQRQGSVEVVGVGRVSTSPFYKGVCNTEVDFI